jgi:hypothetical protein
MKPKLLTLVQHDVFAAYVINEAAKLECARVARFFRIGYKKGMSGSRCRGKYRCMSCAARVLVRNADRYYPKTKTKGSRR